MRVSTSVAGSIAIASMLVAPCADAHNDAYRRARSSGTLWYEISLAAVYRISPIVTALGPSLQAGTIDIASSFPWLPIDVRLRAGMDWRNDGTHQWSGAQLGIAGGVNGGALLTLVTNASWITDPYFSPLNPTAGLTLDWYDVGNGDLVGFGAYVSNTMYFACNVGVRMTAEFPFTTGPGQGTTVGVALVIASRNVWDDAVVGCWEWREYLERSAHPHDSTGGS